MSQDEQNKSEKPTPYKLEEAKKKGQVAKSTEFTGVVSLLLFLVLSYAVSDWFVGSVSLAFSLSMRSIGELGTSNNEVLVTWVWSYLLKEYSVVLPVLFISLIFSIVITIYQIGFLWSTEPIKIDFKRLNPISNLKKIFSIKILFESVKVLLKFLYVGLAGYWLASDFLRNIFSMRYLDPSNVSTEFFELIFVMGLVIGGGLFVFSLIDLAFVRWSFIKDMKMSHREIRDEHKKRDGDPEIKNKRRKHQQEMIKKITSLASVKNADLVVTNPTHYAVALHYEPESMVAPKVLICGKGVLAFLIRRRASKFSVLVKRNPPLARLLYKDCQSGDFISARCFDGVASEYRAIWQAKGL
ncbi:flagellar biosynthesis protein FlhB [Agarivorans sp. DSG3-1]|uniref:EscU/YscU/HrcU family type III secretion system export apparatus switch protein n=1 Tax=Agarivorans sp. DSG3-1 TaxID=3342249 RepID=UPI00398E5AD5